MFTLPTVAFALLLVFELLFWLPYKFSRRILAASLIFELLIFGLLFVGVNPSPYVVLLLTILVYRVCNLLRLVVGRRHAAHLNDVVRRASFWLVGAQAITLVLCLWNPAVTMSVMLGIAILMLGLILIGFSATQRNLRTTRSSAALTEIRTQDLPTVSVLIPARNETEDLSECLNSLIESTYQKLEIIVLDDCSQNHRTPQIIKDFAQQGVRFIAGDVPPAAWLAKNHAYSQLTKAASGDLLLFCGVDTRFKPLTIEKMVREMITRNKMMISFIPANIVPPASNFASLLVQPSRYAWELALPRRSLNRPPVLSTTWMISQGALKAAGSFAAVSRSIDPERYFARHAALHDDGYSFQQSDTADGLSSAKSFSEQRATAVRTRYPQLHQSLELTAAISLFELFVLLGPFVIYGIALLNTSWLLFIVADIAAILSIVAYAQLVNLTYRKFMWRSIWLFPFAVIYDIALLNFSMYKYEFSDVQWKGRNVCIPVMQVIDRLPEV